MRNLTEIEKNAFARLVKTADGFVMMDYLEEALQDQDINNRKSPIENIQRGQGKALLLDELIIKLRTE